MSDVTDQYDPDSAWWHFKSLMNNVDEDYEALNPQVRKSWQQFEEIELRQTPQVEERALRAYKCGKFELMEELLTRYTYTHLNAAYNRAWALNEWVLEQSDEDQCEAGQGR
jgi:dipeptidase